MVAFMGVHDLHYTGKTGLHISISLKNKANYWQHCHPINYLNNYGTKMTLLLPVTMYCLCCLKHLFCLLSLHDLIQVPRHRFLTKLFTCIQLKHNTLHECTINQPRL